MCVCHTRVLSVNGADQLGLQFCVGEYLEIMKEYPEKSEIWGEEGP